MTDAPGLARRERRDRDRALFAAGKVEVVHGTTHAYNWWGCRCPECVGQESDRSKARHAEAKRAFAAGEVEIVHGETRNYVWYGCRCRACTDAELDRQASYGYRPARKVKT